MKYIAICSCGEVCCTDQRTKYIKFVCEHQCEGHTVCTSEIPEVKNETYEDTED